MLHSVPSNERITFTVNDSAKAVGVGRTLLYSEIKSGRLRAFKLRGRTLIHAEDLQSWVNSYRTLQ